MLDPEKLNPWLKENQINKSESASLKLNLSHSIWATMSMSSKCQRSRVQVYQPLNWQRNTLQRKEKNRWQGTHHWKELQKKLKSIMRTPIPSLLFSHAKTLMFGKYFCWAQRRLHMKTDYSFFTQTSQEITHSGPQKFASLPPSTIATWTSRGASVTVCSIGTILQP